VTRALLSFHVLQAYQINFDCACRRNQDHLPFSKRGREGKGVHTLVHSLHFL
jgi:hypothetical protein